MAPEEYGDMIEAGIIDPTKVTRTALQNAASIAGLMITTECVIADRLLQSLIELSPRGSEERSLLESISNHVGARGAMSPELFAS